METDLYAGWTSTGEGSRAAGEGSVPYHQKSDFIVGTAECMIGGNEANGYADGTVGKL